MKLKDVNVDPENVVSYFGPKSIYADALNKFAKSGDLIKEVSGKPNSVMPGFRHIMGRYPTCWPNICVRQRGSQVFLIRLRREEDE